MIDFELKLDYKTSDNDELYRDQFLKFFILDTYHEKIIEKKQNRIYKELNDNDIFKDILIKLKDKHSLENEEMSYIMMYSFDYFDTFSEVIKVLIYYKENKVSYESLKTELIKLKDKI